jgi:hypothetical protein
VIQTPQGQIGHVALLFIARPNHCRRPRPPDASPAIPPHILRQWSFSAHPDPVSTRRASGLGFVAQPSNPTVFWWTTANPACRLQLWAATLHRLQSMTSSCFSCHMRPALDPAGHRVPRVRPTCLSTPRRPRKAQTFRAHSSLAPMQIKPQPAPAILGQESVYTMLSITHHSQERPSTSPRTLWFSKVKKSPNV